MVAIPTEGAYIHWNMTTKSQDLADEPQPFPTIFCFLRLGVSAVLRETFSKELMWVRPAISTIYFFFFSFVNFVLCFFLTYYFSFRRLLCYSVILVLFFLPSFFFCECFSFILCQVGLSCDLGWIPRGQ